MANNWKFFQDTGKVGGTANLGHNVAYIDSYNGNDSNVGSNVAPFKTIQKAIDVMNDACDFVVAGDFSNITYTPVRGYGSIICEGEVVFSAPPNTGFYPFLYQNNINKDISNGGKYRDYGRAIFKNYDLASALIFIVGNYGGTAYKCEFINCQRLSYSPYFIGFYLGCNFVNSNFNFLGNAYGDYVQANSAVIKCTFINTQLIFSSNSASIYVKSCYFDSNSYFKAYGYNPFYWNYNFAQGSAANRLVFGGVSYNDIEAVKAVLPQFGVNDLGSATVPLLNTGTVAGDYTLQEGSPLKFAGHDAEQIGCFTIGNSYAADNIVFDIPTNVTVTGGVATLTTPGVGTLETSVGVPLFSSPRRIGRLSVPGLVVNRSLGEVLGSNLAADNTPYLQDVEIKFSLDDITYFPTSGWLRMRTGAPLQYDPINDVGDDDPLFVKSTAIDVVAKYMKFKVTLRDNEVNL
jgi:hypothetical protein